MNREDFPALYKSADEHSANSQKYFFRTLKIQLGLLVIAAVLSGVNEATKFTAYLQAFTLLASLGCSVFLYTQRFDRQWYAARAVAESIKTISWRYVVRSEPFNQDDPTVTVLFAKKLSQIVEQNQEVTRHFTSFLAAPQITQQMKTYRSQSLSNREKLYRDHRINDQLTWYENKAKENNKSYRNAFCLMILSNAIAATFAILRPEFLRSTFWPTDVFVTFAAVGLTWMQTRRYSELAASYSLAAHEINIINEQSFEISTEECFSRFVSDAENAFSREHTQWSAREDR